MSNYEFPTNIKQIGNVDERLRVYMEDYVYSYMLTTLREKENDEYIFALVGRCMIIDGQKVLFISGAIDGNYSEIKKGLIVFSEKSKENIEEERLKYFKGLEIVGWVLSQPGYGNYLSGGHINYHLSNFSKPYQIMLVIDLLEKINTFFIAGSEKDKLDELNGFFIYYEKNMDMQHYIEKKKMKTLKVQDEIKEVDSKKVKVHNESEKNEKVNLNSKSKNKSKNDESNILNLNKNENKIKNNNVNNLKQPKMKLNNYLTAISMILFLITFIMGSGLISNENKISKLEEEVYVLRDAYNLLVTHLNNNIQPVFASNDSQVSTTIVTDTSTNESLDTSIDEDDFLNNVIEENEKEEKKIGEEIETEEEEVEELTLNNNDSFSSNLNYIPEVYVVQQGDNLISISRMIYGTEQMQGQIMEYNDIEDPNKIYFGMQLKLPR